MSSQIAFMHQLDLCAPLYQRQFFSFMKLGKYTLALLLVPVALPLLAQSPQADVPVEQMLPRTMAYVLIAAAALLFIVTLYLVVRVNQLMYKRLLTLQAEKDGLPTPEADEVSVPEESFWTRMRKRYWEDVVPVEREHEILKHHEFDGIRELDNSLPPWWVNLFILCVIWAGVFMFYYHFGGGGPNQYEYYEREMEQAKKRQAIAIAGQSNAVDETNVTALTDAGSLGEGELIYKASCAACHGQAGEGGVGPNMTDPYWLHGGGIKNIFRVIKYGVPEKGMIAWSAQLKPGDMQKVASYILTMEGSNPPNAKGPQGEIWKEEAPAPDSTGGALGHVDFPQ